MNNPIDIPALRLGRFYKSLDATTLKDMRTGDALAHLSMVNDGIVKRDLLDLSRAKNAYAEFDSADLVKRCIAAADFFFNGTLPIGGDGAIQSPDDYVRMLSATTGLPYSLCRRNMGKLEKALSEMDAVLKGLTRGLPPEVFDRNVVEIDGLDVSFFPTAETLGIVLPSNSPGVNSLWLPAIPMKTPILLKPGREDPWTPLRLIEALVAAGIPREVFGFYPTGHDGAETLLRQASRGIVFGGEATVNRYAANPNIQCHGVGWSKVLIGDDQIDDWESYVDVIVESIAANSGRSCINASAVLVPRHAAAIADAIAKKLAAIEPRKFDDPNALLAGFANPAMADFIEATLENGLAEPGANDVTAKYAPGPVRVEAHGQIFIKPRLIQCDTIEHPLGNTEMLFPFASIVEMPQAEMLQKMGETLVCTAITEDADWIADLLRSPDIDRLNLGPTPTNVVQWDQPHEGNLFEFLYKRRAYQRAG